MQHIFILPLFLIIFLLLGCEKEIITTKEEEETQQENTTSPNLMDDVVIESDTLSVAEAQLAEMGQYITVKGYIVASTTKSMKNIDFEAPFSGSSAIVIADVPAVPRPDDSQLFPVCLTEWKEGRQYLNLEDNPQLWNHIVYLSGVSDKYMSRPGLKQLYEFTIME